MFKSNIQRHLADEEMVEELEGDGRDELVVDPIVFIESHSFHIPEMTVVALVHLRSGEVTTAVLDVFLINHPVWILYANAQCSHLLLSDPHHEGVGPIVNFVEFEVSAILDWRLSEGLPVFCKYSFFYFLLLFLIHFFQLIL